MQKKILGKKEPTITVTTSAQAQESRSQAHLGTRNDCHKLLIAVE